ncbi:MAG: hypothetical protein FWH36_05425, partial [Lentimicrobiaceae bacterium]|nr:hypothetical protein [Lentimicrobiaceae bacterium]
FGGGAYFEMNNGGVGASFGLGYTKLSNTVTVDAVGTTRKMEFVSLPFIGTYEFNITEKFLLGLHVHVGLNYLISEKLDEIAVSSGKKLYTSYGGGLSFSYLFSDAIGISVLPAFSAMLVFEPGSPIYMGFGGQFRFFYAFGY